MLLNDSLKQHVQQINKLPTIPVIASEILRLVNDNKVSVGRLENIVSKDPSISAKILSVANSAFFGFRVPTTTINHSIVRVGFNNVKNIALGISLMTVLEDGKKSSIKSHYRQIFKHSATVSLVSKFVADIIKLNNPEEVLLNGLLHDVGYLVINRYFPESYEKIVDSLKDGASMHDAEITVLGFTHNDIGAWLTGQWKLPDMVTDTVLHHHSPSGAGNSIKYVSTVHIADYITSKNICSITGKDSGFAFDPSSLEILNITENDLKYIEAKLSEESISDEIFRFD